MFVHTRIVKASRIAIATSMFLTAGSVIAQDTVPAPTASAPSVAPAATPAPAPAVTPPPVVPTVTSEPITSDRISPTAAASVEEERAERAATTAKAAPARRERVATAPRTARGAVPVENEANAPVIASSTPSAEPVVTDNLETEAISAISETPVEATAPEVAEPVPISANDDWMVGAGIAGALGLAGVGAALAMRRRRRPTQDVREETVVAMEPLAAAPAVSRPNHDFADKMAPAPVRQYQARTMDPVMARKPLPANVTDPLFLRTVEAPPVTDPMFSREIDVPPITDPMFANHPAYEGKNAPSFNNRRSWPDAGDADGTPARERELVN